MKKRSFDCLGSRSWIEIHFQSCLTDSYKNLGGVWILDLKFLRVPLLPLSHFLSFFNILLCKSRRGYGSWFLSFSNCPILLFFLSFTTDCYANLGGGMDPGSGVFTCPIAGSYLFIVHVCSADMHKALLSIRYFLNNFNWLFFNMSFSKVEIISEQR